MIPLTGWPHLFFIVLVLAVVYLMFRYRFRNKMFCPRCGVDLRPYLGGPGQEALRAGFCPRCRFPIR